jgi:hypothetical protein
MAAISSVTSVVPVVCVPVQLSLEIPWSLFPEPPATEGKRTELRYEFMNLVPAEMLPMESRPGFIGYNHTYTDDDKFLKVDVPIVTQVPAATEPDQAFKQALRILAGPPHGVSVFEVAGAFNSKKLAVLDPSKNALLGHTFTLSFQSETKLVTSQHFTLVWAAVNNRLAIVAGSGMSKSMTHKTAATWDGLLRTLANAVYPQAAATPPTSLDRTRFDGLISSNLAVASEYLFQCAEKDFRARDLSSSLLSTMSGLVPTEATPWTAILRAFQGPILTFNYDIATEIAAGREPLDFKSERGRRLVQHAMISPSEPVFTHKLTHLSGKDATPANVLTEKLRDVVLHLHGIYTQSESIVLRPQTYLDAAGTVPRLFQELAEASYVFLYIGVKGILSDPDLVPFWRWEEVRYALGHHVFGARPMEHTHLVLHRSAEDISTVLPRGADNLAALPYIRSVPYGDHPDLDSFVLSALNPL